MPTTHQWEIQNSMFRTPVRCFFRTFKGSKPGLELSQVKLYRHYLRGNKNFFELAGGSSYQGFVLLRVLKIDLFMVYDAILAGGANMAKITVNV